MFFVLLIKVVYICQNILYTLLGVKHMYQDPCAQWLISVAHRPQFNKFYLQSSAK